MIKLGQQLENLCQNAQSEIILVAPFIKASILARILKSVQAEVKIKCVTRWLPEDILAGVSDLEVWSVMQTVKNASLWLRSNLHAKYYRADNLCLIGSANLTAKALGWSNVNNLEILYALPASEPNLQQFEQDLFLNTIQVDVHLFNQFQECILQLKQENLSIPPLSYEPSINLSFATWLPTLRNPEELYLAYNKEWDKLTPVARQAALNDLSYLPVISNLPKTAFNIYIGMLLLQMPIIQRIDIFVKTPQRFGAVTEFLVSIPCANNSDFNPSRAWQTLMRWLLYFLPQRYTVSVPRHSEVFYRVS